MSKVKKTLFFNIIAFFILLANLGIAAGVQPSGNVSVSGVNYTEEIQVVANDSIVIISNATLQNAPITPTNNYPNFTVTGQFSWIINTSNVVTTTPYYVAMNLTMPADSSFFSVVGNATNTTVVNITDIVPSSNNFTVVIAISNNNTIAKLDLNLSWNITISKGSQVYQLTSFPLQFPDFNSTDVKYVQNFTVTAPFANNITLNVTLPDGNVTLNEVSGNDTIANKSAEYVWFDIYNVDANGISPQINYTAEKIVTLSANAWRSQGSAEVGKNVTWNSTYTVAYNSSFSSLIVENLVVNHELWQDADISTNNISFTGNFSPSIQVPQSGFNGGYANLTFPTFNATNSTTITFLEWTPAPLAYLPQYEQYPAQTGKPVWWNESINLTNPALEDYSNVRVRSQIFPDINTSTLNFLGDPSLNLTSFAKVGNTILEFNISFLTSSTTNVTYKFNFTTPAPTVSQARYEQYIAFINQPVWWNVTFYVNNPAQESYKDVLVLANANGTCFNNISCSPLAVNTSQLNWLEGANQTGLSKSGSSINWTVTLLSANTNASYKFNFTTRPPTKVESVIGAITKGSTIWQKEINVTNPINEAPYLVFLNTTFKSLKIDGLYANNTNLTQNIEWFDTDNDTYYEKVQWNYTILPNTTLRFLVNGSRWTVSSISMKPSLIHEDEYLSLSGKAKYMDGDALPFAIVHIYRYNFPYRTINLSLDSAGAFSTQVSDFSPGRYYIWIEFYDEDNILVKSNKISLFVYAVSPPVSALPPVAKPYLESKTVSITKAAKVIFEKTANHTINSINIFVKAPAASVVININLTTPPKILPNIYKTIKIDVENLNESNIENVTISFQVEKSWIIANNIDPNKVYLYRYTTDWNKLPTEKVSEDTNYVYYKAISPGLSIYAIAGEKITKPAPKPPAPVCGNGICEAGEDYTTCPQDCPRPTPPTPPIKPKPPTKPTLAPGIKTIVSAIIIIVIAIIAFVLIRKF